MTEDNLTPSSDLVRQWNEEALSIPDPLGWSEYIATQAALWGANQELEACCEWVTKWKSPSSAGLLRRDRRPKPPSLSEQAFAALSKIENNEATYGDAGIILKALHKLQQYEQQKNKKN